MAFEQRPQGQPSPTDFGTEEEIEQFLVMAEQATGLSRDKFMQYGQQGIDYQTKKAASDPQGAGTVAGSAEIQRFMAGAKEQLAQLQNQNQQGAPSPFQAAQPTDQKMGLQPPAPPIYAESQGFQPTTPSAAALQRLYSGRIKQLEGELDQERMNNLKNAAKESYDRGRQEGERRVIAAGADRVDGSPAAKQRLADAQNRRALARQSLEQRLSKLSKSRA